MNNNVSLSDSGWNLQSNYTQISDKLFSELKPDIVTNPSTVIVNNELAKKLGLNLNGISEKDLSNLFLDESNVDLSKMNDEELKEKLLSVFGIGPWSVNMFEIFCIGNLNVFSSKDAGLRLAMNNSKMIKLDAKG